jgi:hypothetical protein
MTDKTKLLTIYTDTKLDQKFFQRVMEVSKEEVGIDDQYCA